MGKYTGKITASKDDGSYENLQLAGLEAIANELAEANRLKRLELTKAEDNYYTNIKDEA